MKASFSTALSQRFRLIFLFLLAFNCLSYAAEVDTVSTYSAVMKKTIKAVVIKPEGYEKGRRFPTVYLLHGYGGDYSNYVLKIPALKDYADQYQLLLVCPDGSVSWYLDSPVDPKSQYETYITKELIPWIDKKYNTLNERGKRAVTGLSMGGHGALALAIKHQALFGAAGSMSGGLDLRPFPGNWDIAKSLGSYAAFADRWKENSVTEMLPLLSTGKLALIIDCGKDDFFYGVNKVFHEKLIYNNIAHDFIVRPGAHNWTYWSSAIAFQLLYFDQFFKTDKK